MTTYTANWYESSCTDGVIIVGSSWRAVNADIHSIKTMFVEEDEKIANPLGVRGMGELGMVGTPAAIANPRVPCEGPARPRPADHAG